MCLPAALAVHSDGQHHHATTLTIEVFDKFLEEKRTNKLSALIMFHVSWCKVCVRTFPKFANASTLAHEKGVGIGFAHVDCTEDKTLCQRYGISGYPSIKLFSPEAEATAAPRQYRGPRTEEGFLSYVQRMTQPAVRVNLDSSKALQEAMTMESLAGFVALVPKGAQTPKGLAAAAETWMDRHVFAATPKLADLLPKGFKPPDEATLASVSTSRQQWPGKDNKTKATPAVAFYTGPLDDVSSVSTWVETHRFPGVWIVDDTNFYEFTHANRSTVLISVDPGAVLSSHEQAIRGAEKTLEADYLFGVLDGVSWADELADFNIKRSELPRALVTENNLDIWIEDVEALRVGNLEEDLKSLVAGAPLLRQDRGFLSRGKFYGREAWRIVIKAKGFATKGPFQAGLVGFAALSLLAGVVMVFWFLSMCIGYLMEPDDYPPNYAQELKKKQ